jgi:hypothetical protein
MDQRGLDEAATARSSLVVVSLVKSELLARGVVRTMIPVSNLDDGRLLHRCVCSLPLVARMVVCVLAMVVFYDGRRGCLYDFRSVSR